jgi:hypothetical protein
MLVNLFIQVERIGFVGQGILPKKTHNANFSVEAYRILFCFGSQLKHIVYTGCKNWQFCEIIRSCQQEYIEQQGSEEKDGQDDRISSRLRHY